jgi:hypothetical protein
MLMGIERNKRGEDGGALFRLAEALPVSPFFSPFLSLIFFWGSGTVRVAIFFLDLYRNHVALAHALIPMFDLG